MRLLYLLILWLPMYLSADAPNAFHQLGKSFEHDRPVILFLEDVPYFKPYKIQFSAYRKSIEISFDTGYELDQLIAEERDAVPLSKTYLNRLRRLAKDQKKIEYIYVKALNHAIKNRDTELYEQLLVHALSPLKHPTVKLRATAFYKTIRDDNTIEEGEMLLADEELELYSREVAAQMQQAYDEHIRVLSTQELKQLKERDTSDPRYKVAVSTDKTSKGYIFYAENSNPYTVTVTLEMKELVNFSPSVSLPLHIELEAKTSKKILELVQENRKKRSTFSSSFGWVKGSARARHDSALVYRVPFALSSRIPVSQGFDGKKTHKGLSKYAVDFSCPIGTKIFAARAGKVVDTASRHDKGGFDKSFGKYANYIVIEHADGTFGNYYHLKQNGVGVEVGEMVKRGQFIGKSGNTGYTSGPHLHFSVSTVEPRQMRRPMTLPFRFRTAGGLVSYPKQGDWYTVVK